MQIDTKQIQINNKYFNKPTLLSYMQKIITNSADYVLHVSCFGFVLSLLPGQTEYNSVAWWHLLGQESYKTPMKMLTKWNKNL